MQSLRNLVTVVSHLLLIPTSRIRLVGAGARLLFLVQKNLIDYFEDPKTYHLSIDNTQRQILKYCAKSFQYKAEINRLKQEVGTSTQQFAFRVQLYKIVLSQVQGFVCVKEFSFRKKREFKVVCSRQLSEIECISSGE